MSFDQLAEADLNSGGVQWSIDGFIERGTMHVFFGPPGVAKTFLALDMALSIATGHSFATRPTTRGLVAYVGGEGPRAFGRRLRAWSAGHEHEAVGNSFLYIPDRIGLTRDVNMQALAATIETKAEEADLKVEHVVFDTWQRHLEGDENSTGDVAKACRNIFGLRDRMDCSISVLHHTGWGDASRIRGARVLEGECDGMWQIDLNEADHVTTLTCQRMRDGDKPQPQTFKGHRAKLSVSENSSWYLEHRTDLKPTAKVEYMLGDRERDILKAIRALYAEERQRMIDEGISEVAAEVTQEMLRRRLVFLGKYTENDKERSALRNILGRLRDKGLIVRRGQSNMVPM